ncbi:MAG: peptide deformylase [Oscillospiraceae bacterium]|nr:peptide deformylase [Oscillospiraceae bacterium]MBR6677685.1 peptide deformylase [Oscillospiraceae bacterium]
MVREIMHDPIFLGIKSEPATREDLQVAQDLLDTLIANRDGCVGMAANMIGVRKRIIVFDNDGSYMTMFNPEILKSSGMYEAEEGCLSLLGGLRKCKRYQTIKVQWKTAEFQTRIKTFVGWPAQIIQHEIDHCNGVLI